MVAVREARRVAKAERDKLLAGVRDDLSGMVARLSKPALARLKAVIENGAKQTDITWTDAELTRFTEETAKILHRALEMGIVSGIERKKAYLGLKVQEAQRKSRPQVATLAFGTWVWDKGIESPAVRKWLEETAGAWSVEKMTTFTDSIRQAVGESVGRGIAEGETWEQLIARVQAVDEEFSTFHALLIAQMETSTAFQEGSNELFKQTGIAFKSAHWDGGKCGHVSTDGIEDVCIANETLGVVPIDFQYPSQFGPVDGAPFGYGCGCDIYPELGEGE